MAQFFKPKRKKSTPKQAPVTTADVIALSHQGQGVVKLPQGNKQRVYFVDDALPGENIRLRPLKGHQAEFIERLSTSEHRQQPPCPYYQHCGGCDMQHLDAASLREHKQATVTELFAKFAQANQLPWQAPIISPAVEYRRKARLAVKWHSREQSLWLGFRRPQSQSIVNIEHCLVLDPALDALLEPLRELLESARIGAVLGHVELIKAEQLHVVLRIVKPLAKQQQQQLTAFSEQHQVHTWLQNDDELIALEQDSSAYDLSLDTDRLYFTAGDFLQVNAAVNQAMVAQAMAWLAPNKEHRVLDLFAGIGNFTLPLARRAQSVIAIEGIERMTQRIADNAAAANLATVTTHTQDLATLTAAQVRGFGADLWLLDPARAGAEQVAQLLNKLSTQHRPQRILYVSCSPDTLARDSQHLLHANYAIKKIGLVDMFPQTHHIETMVCFEMMA